jgi:hypothetical protein
MSEWRPIAEAEASFPPPSEVPSYWRFPCLLQNERGSVGEGFAAYVGNFRREKGNNKPPFIRWYSAAFGRVEPRPKYWMSLPEPLTGALSGPQGGEA